MQCVCGKVATKWCSGCNSISYCSVACQKADWPTHKLVCSPRTPAPRECLERTASKFQRKLTGFESGDEAFSWRFPTNLSGLEQSVIKILLHEAGFAETTASYRTHMRSCWRRKIEFFVRRAAKVGNYYRHLETMFWLGDYLNSTSGKPTHDGGEITYLGIIIYHNAAILPGVVFWKLRFGEPLPEEGKGTVLSITTQDILRDFRTVKEPIGVLALLPPNTRPEEYLDWETGKQIWDCDYKDGYVPPASVAEECRLVPCSGGLVDFVLKELHLSV